jgi:AraC family transcriptional regulator
MMTDEIRTIDLTACRTAVIRARMAPNSVARWLPGAYRRVARALERQGEQPRGPAFARYTVDGDLVAVEAGFPVGAEIAEDGSVVASELPGGPAVVATHTGRFETVDDTFEIVDAWLETHGLAAAATHWESYRATAGDEWDPSRLRTDVVVPYQRSADSRRWDVVGEAARFEAAST